MISASFLAIVSSSSGAWRRTIWSSCSRLGVVEPQVQAAALQRLGELTRVVTREEDDRPRLRLDPAELRDADLEVREQLEQHRLELLVGLVDLVDQEDDRLGRCDRGHERAGEQELLAEDVLLHVLPAGGVRLGLDPEQLLAVVPLVQRLRLVQALVALEPDEGAVEVSRKRLGEFGLAHAGRALDEHRLAELGGEERDERGRLAGEVAGVAEAGGEVGGGGWFCRGHGDETKIQVRLRNNCVRRARWRAGRGAHWACAPRKLSRRVILAALGRPPGVRTAIQARIAVPRRHSSGETAVECGVRYVMAASPDRAAGLSRPRSARSCHPRAADRVRLRAHARSPTGSRRGRCTSSSEVSTRSAAASSRRSPASRRRCWRAARRVPQPPVGRVRLGHVGSPAERRRGVESCGRLLLLGDGFASTGSRPSTGASWSGSEGLWVSSPARRCSRSPRWRRTSSLT